ncbi:ABC transporter substrate-binding protein [Sporosarcina sp. 179-K 3D1 HS]|uniref:ABC transporter substrate-binding protein n=1 Tax=Sporosarcina sp. 179-K 3D1 HS TaxID=3232169 RepID=UPI0039A39F1B
MNNQGKRIKRKMYGIKGILCLLLMLLLAACGGQTEGTSSSAAGSNGSSGTTEGKSDSPQGVTDSEILVGFVGPQTGATAIYDSNRKAIESYFKYVNENGGVDGRTLKLIAYDNQGEPAKTVQAVKRLVEQDKVFAMVGNTGSSANLAVLDYYKKTGIPVIMAGTGNGQLVNPPVPNVLGISVINYSIEARLLLDYAVNQADAKTIAIAYQNDELGKEGLEAIKEAIGNYPDVEIVEEVNFLQTDVEFSSQAQKIQKAKPDAVIVLSTPNPAANLKKALHRIGADDIAYVVTSVGGNDTNLFELAGEDVWNGTISAATIPIPGGDDDSESLKLFVERFGADYPKEPLIGVSQSGWGSAEVFVEGLKRAGDNLDWPSFLETFYTFDNWQDSIYAGISFSEDNHYGVTSLYMTEAKDGKIESTSVIMTVDPKTGEVTSE